MSGLDIYLLLNIILYIGAFYNINDVFLKTRVSYFAIKLIIFYIIIYQNVMCIQFKYFIRLFRIPKSVGIQLGF